MRAISIDFVRLALAELFQFQLSVQQNLFYTTCSNLCIQEYYICKCFAFILAMVTPVQIAPIFPNLGKNTGAQIRMRRLLFEKIIPTS